MSHSRHASDSSAQQIGEAALVSLLREKLGYDLATGTVHLNDGVAVQLDGFSREHQTLCEVYCRIGALKGSQPDKLASDMLKLVLVERELGGGWRKILCMADAMAAKSLQGRSWLAAATRAMSFEVVVLELPAEVMRSITAAQDRQKMINRSA